MYKKLKPTILEVNILYLILAVFLLFIGSYVQSVEIYSGLLITEYILVLLPGLLFLRLRDYSIKRVVRLNKINLKQGLMVIVITACTYPLAVFLQSIVVNVINNFIDVIPRELPLPITSSEYLLGLFIIAISPGICEEVIFRGIILDAYEAIGRKKSIIISSFLFAIFHFTIFNLVGPLLLGLVFGIMVYQTNSIYSSILGHIVNNGIAWTIGFYMNKYGYLLDRKITREIGSMSKLEGVILSLAIIALLLGCLFIVIKLLKSLSMENTLDKGEIFRLEKDYLERGSFSNIFKYLPVLLVIVIFILLNWLLIGN